MIADQYPKSTTLLFATEGGKMGFESNSATAITSSETSTVKSSFMTPDIPNFA